MRADAPGGDGRALVLQGVDQVLVQVVGGGDDRIREACLVELRRNGFRLEESWYEVPVSPKRYYKNVSFPESDCKNAVFFAEHVINLPTWYNTKKKQKELALAKKIIKNYQIK